ncbi:MAG: undecaprenyl/decaprenyl-phosphate alpha-N-acetylglucosaminyl 1-phosphate transferase [Phycisphaerales bacterium]|nr:undecaprenyl/decaprenyl-phosphate alpha-N-acetylglucosaminyl 1-phosphate transferase [Phycisphaerales bacterium]
MMPHPSAFTVLQPYMPVFYASFLVALVLTPLMRHLAIKNGVVDEPDFKRKVHAHPIAYLGGIATFMGWMAGIVTSYFIHPMQISSTSLTAVQVPPGVIAGAMVIVATGVFDDFFGLSPRYKIFGQFLAGGLLFFGNLDQLGYIGARLDMANMVVNPLERHQLIGVVQHWALYPTIATMFSALMVIFIIIAACNATNLLDGLDGLCSGVTGIMAVGYLILAVHLATANLTTPGVAPVDPVRISMSLALLGAVLGFLPFNFNPASIFMGDTGSMFLGYVCGTMIVMFAHDGIARWFLAAVVIFGLPMLDTLLAIVRRKLNGRPVFSPDSGHFHHFLVRRGLSVRKAVLVSYGLTAMFVSFALVIVIIPTQLALGIYLVLFGWLVVAAFKMGMIFQQGAAPAKKPFIPPVTPRNEPPSPASQPPVVLPLEKQPS